MAPRSSLMVRRVGRSAVFAAVMLVAVAAAQAQLADSGESGSLGRIRFNDSDLPPATVEVDLNQSMFRDLFGLGDAAVAGVAETLLQSAGTNRGSEGTRLAAEQLQAARQIMQLAGDVVREVRVRVYNGLPGNTNDAGALVAPFDTQLRAENWDTIVRVRDGNDSVRVSLLRNEGALRGVFVVAANGSELVLANVVCDASPENVKKLTSAAAKIGLENGLQQVIEAKMRQLQRHMPPDTPRPPHQRDSQSAD